MSYPALIIYRHSDLFILYNVHYSCVIHSHKGDSLSVRIEELFHEQYVVPNRNRSAQLLSRVHVQQQSVSQSASGHKNEHFERIRNACSFLKCKDFVPFRPNYQHLDFNISYHYLW